MINKEMFAEWLESPVTETLKKYLKDSADEERRLIMEAISNGGIIDEKEQIRRGTVCLTLESIGDIDLDEIERFYDENYDQ